MVYLLYFISFFSTYVKLQSIDLEIALGSKKYYFRQKARLSSGRNNTRVYHASADRHTCGEVKRHIIDDQNVATGQHLFSHVCDKIKVCHCIPGGPNKRKSRYSRFSGLCSNQQLYIFTLLDRASFPPYNNTKIIKFG